MKKIKLFILSILSVVVLFSCSDDNNNTIPEVINEEEVITTVIVTLKNGDEQVILKSIDADGDGKDPKITVSGTLAKNVIYSGSIQLLNETESPAEDITSEVKEESAEHQFFYSASENIATFSYDTTDVDANGNPIGVNFSLKTAENPAKGKLTFTLRHEPNKTAKNVKNGDITNAGGETDIEATFDIEVK